MVGVENDHTGQIHQGTDVGDLLLHRAGEGGVGGDKAHIADEKGGQAHGGGGQQLPPGHPGQVAPLGHPLLQVVGQQKDGAVYHNEKDSRRNKTIDLGFPHKEGVQLPLQRGGEFRQQEGAHRTVARTQQVAAAADRQEQKHEPHGYRHGGHPESHGEGAGSLQPQNLHHQCARCGQPEPGAAEPAGVLEQKEHTGSPLGQSSKQAGHGLTQRVPPPM